VSAAPADARAPTRVPVSLPGRAYEILIGRGLLDEAGPRLAALRPGARIAIAADERVDALHGPRLRAGLDAAGLRHVTVLIPPGEASKSWAGLQHVVESLIDARIERRDLVVALGGGVTGDLAGCAAGLLRRGVDIVQAPTTLLAQVDSSVGGKTGINSPNGKNLIGVFHQPALVLADLDALDTLGPRDFRAGYAEVAKAALLADAGLFAWLERRREEVFAGGPARAEAIAASCRIKAEIVARDEKETGDRALLNLGHTFGHALEAATGFSGRLLHGEGVAIGTALAFRLSARLGLVSPDDAERVERHLRECGLPIRIADVPGGAGDAASLIAAMRQDKKVSGGRLTFILVRGIGRAFVARDVEEDALRAFLEDELRR
jgi:3-dehydroquinate synthase